MLAFKKIAVTGDLASGKSTVCDVFGQLGAYRSNADAIVHQLQSDDLSIITKIIELLGPEVLTEGVLDRKKIATKVFNHPSLLYSLERILHPAVIETIEGQCCQAKEKGFKFFVAEIPLLYEIGYQKAFDAVICITAPIEKRVKRFISRGGNEEDFYRRQRRLLPIQEKLEQADYPLFNAGTLDELRESTVHIYNKLIGPD